MKVKITHPSVFIKGKQVTGVIDLPEKNAKSLIERKLAEATEESVTSSVESDAEAKLAEAKAKKEKADAAKAAREAKKAAAEKAKQESESGSEVEE